MGGILEEGSALLGNNAASYRNLNDRLLVDQDPGTGAIRIQDQLLLLLQLPEVKLRAKRFLMFVLNDPGEWLPKVQ